MSEKEFLQWIYDRLVNVHNENELYDYMHKFKEIINTRAVPDVPELVRYDLACDFDGKYHPDIIEVELGDYVRYDQAAAMIAAKDAEIERLREALNYYANVSPISYDMGRTARAALSGKETK